MIHTAAEQQLSEGFFAKEKIANDPNDYRSGANDFPGVDCVR